MNQDEELIKKHQELARKRENRKCIFLYVFLGLGSAIALFPIYWMVLTALKPIDEIFIYPPTFLPSRLAFENFVEAWNSAPFGRYFINSIIITGLTTASHIAIACLTAYAFVVLRFPGRDVIFLAFLGTMMVPSVVTLVPTFVLIKKLNWINTYRGLVIPHMVSVFGIFLLRQFFLSIPKDYEDAARIDGCGRFGILWRMYIPLAKPAIAALAIFPFTTCGMNSSGPLLSPASMRCGHYRWDFVTLLMKAPWIGSSLWRAQPW
jgi:multiple sugar transport system permease protein